VSIRDKIVTKIVTNGLLDIISLDEICL